jgi:hypothetical protein
MMYGYAALMAEYNSSFAINGSRNARAIWKERLLRLARNVQYEFGNWRGDLFDKSNPLWLTIGVVKPGKPGRGSTVLNTGAAQAQCSRVLRKLVALENKPPKIEFLANQ